MRRVGGLPVAATLAASIAVLMLAAPSALAEVHQYKMRFGPLTLGGYEVRQNTSPVKSPPVDGYIVGMRAHVVDKQGRDIPIRRLMLHHVLFTNLGRFDGDRHDGACPDIPRERFFGTGEEHQVLRLPAGYGLPIHRGERWRAAWMLMNHKIKADTGYLEYDVTVVTGEHLHPVKAYWLDTTGCRGGVYWNVPGGGAPGSSAAHAIDWTVPADGRLVAGGAHLHGGAKAMRLRQPRCGNRRIIASRPLYGLPSDPVYHVLPVLHEPGPIDTSWFTTRTGIPVVKGETIVAAGSYDGQFPHVKVMSVMHLYMARAKHVPHDCEPLPRDLVNTNRKVPGRLVAPRIVVPLTGIGPGATAQTIDRPPGPDQWLDGATDVTVSNFAFSVPNLSIPQGASITWRFPDSIAHDVTLANGPVGFSSLFSRAGRTYTQHFDVPGTYRLFCSLHPVVMHEVVDVRAATPDAVAPPAVPPLPRAGVGRPAVPPDTIHW